MIQSITGTAASAGTSISGTFPGNVSSGNFIVVVSNPATGGSGTIISISDTQNNTYSRVFTTLYSVGAANNYIEMWCAQNISGGTDVVTINFGSTGLKTLMAAEFCSSTLAGVYTSPLDVFTSGTASSGTITCGPTGTTTQARELLIAVAGNNSGRTYTKDVNFTNMITLTVAGNQSIAMQEGLVSTIGAQSGSFILNAFSAYGAGIATFKVFDRPNYIPHGMGGY